MCMVDTASWKVSQPQHVWQINIAYHVQIPFLKKDKLNTNTIAFLNFIMSHNSYNLLFCIAIITGFSVYRVMMTLYLSSKNLEPVIK